MRWVYILKCEDDNYYVGETTRLYRRFWEHQSGNGSLNTSIYKPEKVVSIYKVNVISNFIEYNNYVNDYLNKKSEVYKYNSLNQLKYWDEYCDETKFYGKCDNLIAENNIAECLMIHKKSEWTKIKGGKYTRFDINYKYPNNECIKDLPLCNCGLPCDIRKNKENKFLFFRCAKKNMWDGFKEIFEIYEEPCKFYMEYSKDSNFRLELKQKDEKRKEQLKELFKKSWGWLGNVEKYNGEEDDNGCIECGEDSLTKLLTRYDEKIRLCFDCFIFNNEELSNKYSLDGKCLIKIKVTV